ncbi:MAG TPA: SUMF1/EgtB/PvdO family nonheme iron enzyme, partial [Spirochaetota bacterium]|nr:SUMF1/EgtB/PvdO family nonheme iron enzyme [Spirochaetota bacterium]
MKFYSRRHFIFMMLLITALVLPSCESAPQRNRAETMKTVEGIELVYIPGGSFMMGSKESPEEGQRRYGGDIKSYRTEHPYHKVTLSAFWMGKYEVTQRQYEAVMG